MKAVVALVVFGVFTSSAICQSSQISVPDTKLRTRYENRVAQMFEAIRQDSRLPHLARIRHRNDLEQLVCSAAVHDQSPWGHNWPALLMYRTADPQSVAEELKQIAQFKDLVEDPTPPWKRYAIAVWPTLDKQTKERVWWVGAGIYYSAMWEWFDNNVTDDRPYRNQWKHLVAPGCRNVD
jgi:hypothetical protein